MLAPCSFRTGLSKNFSFWTVSLDLDAMFKIKSLLYKDLILNSRGCRKSNQLLRHPRGFIQRRRFCSAKTRVQKCTRMYTSGQAIFKRLTEKCCSKSISLAYSAAMWNRHSLLSMMGTWLMCLPAFCCYTRNIDT